MPKKDAPEFYYNEKRKLYSKKIKNELGLWISVYGKTKQEVREKVKARQAEIELMKVQMDSPLVCQYAASWFDVNIKNSSLSATAVTNYRVAINKYICPVIGEKHMCDVTFSDSMSVLTTKTEFADPTKLSKATQQKIVLTMKRIFDAAERDEVVHRSPCRDLVPMGAKAKPKAALTKAHQRTLLRVVEGAPVEAFVKMALYSGLRREEILGLQWDCVELEDAAPHIKVRRALRWNNGNQPEVTEVLKSGAARRDIPIPSQLVACLKAAKENSNGDYVIANSEGGPISQTSFKNLWAYIDRRSTGTASRLRVDRENGGELKKQKVKKKLGEQIPKHNIYYEIDFNVTPHILRHTYITELILGGVDPKTV